MAIQTINLSSDAFDTFTFHDESGSLVDINVTVSRVGTVTIGTPLTTWASMSIGAQMMAATSVSDASEQTNKT